MIQELTIKNFKSIKKLKIDCKKLNVFIGEPNSGKSNIIEALALQSQNNINNQTLHPDLFRYKTIGNLFYDFAINSPIEIITNERKTVLKYSIRENGILDNRFHLIIDTNSNKDRPIVISHEGKIDDFGSIESTNVHYYEFKRLKSFRVDYMPHLSVPFGDNIPTLLLSNPELKKWVSELFRNFGFRLMLKPTEGDLSMSKEVNEELYEYPYHSISETLQRLIFYSLAIKSNKEMVLLFDEPENNMFPFYIKDFAERLTEDENNQFFISTHNPYLLGSILDKQDMDKLAVFIVRMENYQTKVTQCSERQRQELINLGSGSFFNLSNI